MTTLKSKLPQNNRTIYSINLCVYFLSVVNIYTTTILGPEIDPINSVCLNCYLELHMLICPCNELVNCDNLLAHFISSDTKRTAKRMQQMRIDWDAVGFLRLHLIWMRFWKQMRKMRLQIGNLLINSHISYVLHEHGSDPIDGRKPWRHWSNSKWIFWYSMRFESNF